MFKHTDVLSRRGVTLEYKTFTYGGPMTEAALAGEVDVLFVGDQPAITLISRDPKWRIVARMTNYRSAFLVPPDSPVRGLKDLIGRKVGTAFGSTTHRDAVRILTEAGLRIGKDVQVVNVDQAEHAALIAKGGKDAWGEVSAIATYDPTIAVSVSGRRARVLKEWLCPAVVVTNEDMIRQRAQDLQHFLTAYIEAFAIYARDPRQFDGLYSEDSRLPLPDKVYRSIAAYEPNLSAKDPTLVNILLDASQQSLLQRNADVALKLGIIKRSVQVRDYVDLQLARAAAAEIKTKPSR